jgi:predicted O-methyltransferase YrrM
LEAVKKLLQPYSFRSLRSKRLLKKSWSRIPFPDTDLEAMLGYYEKYRDDLMRVHQEQLAFFQGRYRTGLFPQLCDLEAEMTYLRIRAITPSTVVEISPASGWSTTWILHALKDNGSGTLYSYDLVDDCIRIVPTALSENRWKFYKGDIKQNLHLLPNDIDYLFIDSDHTAEFAYWYIDHLFPLVKKETKISVHDILKWPYEPGWGEESLVLCSWLAEKRIDCLTASRIMKDRGFQKILDKRNGLGIGEMIQSADYNSMIFFVL